MNNSSEMCGAEVMHYNHFLFKISDDIKVEEDIDNGRSKIDVVNEERISVDAYTTNDKDD